MTKNSHVEAELMKSALTRSLDTIERRYIGDKKELILPLQEADVDLVYEESMRVLQMALDEGMQLVQCCGMLGRAIVDHLGIEDEELNVETTRKFFMGYDVLYSYVKAGVIEFIKRDYPRAPYIIVAKGEDEWMEFRLRSLIKDVRKKSKKRIGCPTHWIPNGYDAFKSYGKDMIHNASEVTKLKVSFEMLQQELPIYAQVLNKQQKVPMEVNLDLLYYMQQCKKDNIWTQKHKKMNKKARESVMDSFERAIDDALSLAGAEFYERYHYDYRGRIYSRSANLNYGSHKVAKSLFYFHNKKPLGSTGWNWLLTHTANCWGEDKLPLNDRMEYVEDRLDEWMIWAEDPLNPKHKGFINQRGRIVREGWQTADSPWEFLAAIIEIKKAIDSGNEYKFVSGLPVAIDCSCSGLQVLSLATRCHISAPLCNLVKDEKRGDLYMAIADLVFDEKAKSEELDEVIKEVEEAKKSKKRYRDYAAKNGKRLAKLSDAFWNLHYKKRRKIVKRSAMTYLYSCGVDEMSKHIMTDHETDKDMSGINPIFTFCLAFKIYRACRKLLPGPTSAMDTLMDLAREEFHKGRDVDFRSTYTNFPFMQEYRVGVTKCFEVQYEDGRKQLRVLVDRVMIDHEEIERLEKLRDKRMAEAKNKKHRKNIKKLFNKLIKAKSAKTDSCCGIAPNWTHNKDSDVLAKIIMDCPFDIKTVHDSIACVAADVEDMHEISVQAFKTQLFDRDPLRELLLRKGYMGLIEGIQYGKLNEFYMNEHAIS